MRKQIIKTAHFQLFAIFVFVNVSLYAFDDPSQSVFGFEALPAHDYTLVISINFDSMNRSASVQRITELLDMREFRASLKIIKERAGLDLWETDSLTLAFRFNAVELMNGRLDEFILIWQGPKADLAAQKITSMIESFGQAIERTGNNYSTITFGSGNYTIAIASEGNSLYFGEKNNVDDAIAVARGQISSLRMHPALDKFPIIYDRDAQVLAYISDMKPIADLATIVPNASNAELRMMREKDVLPEAGVFSMSFTEDIIMRNTAEYKDEETAVRSLEVARELQSNPFFGMDEEEFLTQFQNPEDLNRMKELASSFAASLMEMTRRGTITDVTWRIEADSPAFDSLLKIVEVVKNINYSSSRQPSTGNIATSAFRAMDQTRQTTTVARMQKIGMSVELYIMDNKQSPKARGIDELAEIFRDVDIYFEDNMLRDGWGNPFIYEAIMTPGSKSYRIISYGADGKPGPTTYVPGIVKFFDEDIEFCDGRFTVRPLGRQYLQEDRKAGIPPEMVKLRADAEEAAAHGKQQSETIVTMQNYIRKIMSYAIEHPDIGSPKVQSIEELAAILKDVGSSDEILSIRDGWGNLFVYEADMTQGSTSYRLISYGSDGKPGPPPIKDALMARPSEDIILKNHRFVQRP